MDTSRDMSPKMEHHEAKPASRIRHATNWINLSALEERNLACFLVGDIRI